MSCIKWSFCVWRRCQRTTGDFFPSRTVCWWRLLQQRRIHHKYDIILQVEQSSRQQSSAVSAPFLSEHSLAVNEFTLLSGPAKSLMRAFFPPAGCANSSVWTSSCIWWKTQSLFDISSWNRSCLKQVYLSVVSQGVICGKFFLLVKKRNHHENLKTLQEIMCGADAVGCDDKLIYF